jgi:hypothetical protein
LLYTGGRGTRTDGGEDRKSYRDVNAPAIGLVSVVEKSRARTARQTVGMSHVALDIDGR